MSRANGGMRIVVPTAGCRCRGGAGGCRCSSAAAAGSPSTAFAPRHAGCGLRVGAPTPAAATVLGKLSCSRSSTKRGNDGLGDDHLRVEPGMPRDEPCERPIVVVRPVHHRSSREVLFDGRRGGGARRSARLHARSDRQGATTEEGAKTAGPKRGREYGLPRSGPHRHGRSRALWTLERSTRPRSSVAAGSRGGLPWRAGGGSRTERRGGGSSSPRCAPTSKAQLQLSHSRGDQVFDEMSKRG